MKKKIVSFLVSGNGSNYQAVAEKILSGYINAEPGIVISSSSEAFALERSKKLKIKAIAIEPKDFDSKDFGSIAMDFIPSFFDLSNSNASDELDTTIPGSAFI